MIEHRPADSRSSRTPPLSEARERLGVVTGAVVACIRYLRRRERQEKLGFVSEQWIAEYRLGSGQDPRR